MLREALVDHDFWHSGGGDEGKGEQNETKMRPG